LPEELNDRQQDNWELLLAVADAAGGEWPQKARTAALALSDAEERAEASPGEELLRDIRTILTGKDVANIASAELVDALVTMTDRPWGECNHGKAITQNGLARRLKPFGIVPKTVRVGNVTAKGYLLEPFAKAFERYLSLDTPLSTVTPEHPNGNNDSCEKPNVTPWNAVTVEKSHNQLESFDCSGVTVQNPPPSDESEFGKSSTTGAGDWEGEI
jgi:hypothetical protein